MSIYVDEIPPNSPVIVVLIEQEGCGACAEYKPVFEKIAAPFAARGLPIYRIDAATSDANAQNFMDKNEVGGTPAVVAATLHRGQVAKLEGVSNETETLGLFNVA